MRFQSANALGLQVFAVTGINTVSFGLDAPETVQAGLLGFSVDRRDVKTGKSRTMSGYKVFPSTGTRQKAGKGVSTTQHPVQSFVWDDFTAQPNESYDYTFTPVYGAPQSLAPGIPVTISIKTEPLYSNLEHDIFFNRGVASSQAYNRRFGNKRPDEQPTEALKTAAFQWLTRDLDEALLKFIASARVGDTLLCCFYEFRYAPAARALMDAHERGVTVKLILDGKKRSIKENGRPVPPFPRTDNEKTLKSVGFPAANVIMREARVSAIQHNKFMVLIRADSDTAEEVWTGSTNLSESGLAGQTNVGHWVRNRLVAEQFHSYWNLLSTDPGGRKGVSRSEALRANKALQAAVEDLGTAPRSIASIPAGITCIFSPRRGAQVLDLYVKMLDSAKNCGCITLAFGVNQLFKKALENNTRRNALTFLLLEKQDKARQTATAPFAALTAKQNVYQAWGSYIKDPVYRWVRETNARALRVSHHVAYIHSKFLLVDPLGADPIVVTGSANFSVASQTANDENMLIIRGNRRVADIYFTEFNRLFNHYYFRSVQDVTRADTRAASRRAHKATLFLAEDDSWTAKYEPGTYRAKRLALFRNMAT